jgi:hypothetical protein
MHAARQRWLQVCGAEEGVAALLSGRGLPQACCVREGQPQVEEGRQQRRMLHLHALLLLFGCISLQSHQGSVLFKPRGRIVRVREIAVLASLEKVV